MRRKLSYASVAIITLLAWTGQAQENANTTADDTIEIEADDGIEWIRDAKTYVARGNARASRSGLEVLADTLTAHYRIQTDGDSQKIFRLDADGNVRITSASERAYGDKAVYHMDEAVVVLFGGSLRFETTNAVITAHDSLEYWQNKQLAVARGEAVIIQGENRLKADVLSAHFATDASGTQSVEQIDAFGTVHISTPTEIARGDKGVYILGTSIATLCGNVRITRGESQLNGECAEVNLKTGISRLLGGAGRVKGLITTQGGQ
jgi:lipopolysaccharide export system protein LptA